MDKIVNTRKARSARRKRQYLRGVIDAIKNRPCVDCHKYYPTDYMTFDHMPGFQKRANVSELVKKTLKAVVEEILKCELVCRACHDKREIARGRMTPTIKNSTSPTVILTEVALTSRFKRG